MVGVILLFTMVVIGVIVCLVRRDYKTASALLIVVVCSVTAFIWYFTSLPYDIHLKKTPTIQFIKVRDATVKEASQHSLYDTDFPLYIVEILADMRLEDSGRHLCRMYYSPTKSDFNYTDVTSSNSMLIFVSDEIKFIRETDSGYIYHATFQMLASSLDLTHHKEIHIDDINIDLSSRIFLIGMLQPTLSS